MHIPCNKIIVISALIFLCPILIYARPAGDFTPNRQDIEMPLQEIEATLPEIERLFSLCAEKNINTDYEMVDYMVIKDFIGYVRDDIHHRNMERAAYGLKCLQELSANILSSLNAYISGTREPLAVTRYVTGPITIQGSSMIGKAVNPVTGIETTRPLFFTGYGHFDQIINDMHKMTEYGVDILQTEIVPWHTVVEQGQGYGINPAEIEKIENILRDAEINNVRVDVLLAPHYFPGWVLRRHPSLRENTGGFLAFNIYEPEARRVIEAHIIAVMERIKNYTSLNSVCLSNEPVFSTARNFRINRRNSAVNILWRQYLAETHRTINELNNVYRTRYRSFDTVPMPRNIEATPQFYDWMIFNDTVFADWHKWMADVVREAAPNVPVHSKIMSPSLSPAGARAALTWGVDPERFAEFSRFSGNDAFNVLYHNDATIIEKMKWYDFLFSLKGIPVFNSEDHIIEDRDRNYIPQQAIHTRADMWQGAVHGRTLTTIWVWERTHNIDSDFAGSVLHRPDVVSVIGKTNLDLNRLAHEVTALQNAPAHTAILYSNSAKVYDSAYISTISKVYKGLIYNGAKTGFITEKQLAENAFGSYRLIIVPEAIHIVPETLSAIRRFIETGGKALLIGEESLSRDYYGRAISNSDRAFILDNSTVLSNVAAYTELEIRNVIRNILHENNLNSVTLIDNNTGELVYGVEWQSAEYNRKLLVNICNYEWGNSKSISVLINNRPVETARNLITDNIINASNIELAPYTPALLSIE